MYEVSPLELRAPFASVPIFSETYNRGSPQIGLSYPSTTMEPIVENSPSAIAAITHDARVADIRKQLKTLERRDWWLWSLAIVVMLLLTLAVVSLSFPGLFTPQDAFFQFSLNQSVRGLVGLVLLFNTYSIYQQVMIKRLRRQFSQQLDAMGALRIRAEELHVLATTDPLTGLANRRTAERRLQAEAARSQRYGHPLTLVAFDLNEFKHINDQYGHAAGDLVLRGFARRLSNAIRLSDLAVRMGGDEFLLVLPECRIEQVPALLGRIRALDVTFRDMRIPVQFSAGCVAYQPGETPDQFLERADQILYADKRAGKARSEGEPALR
jgi:diguanylate cyclase (GGDEF)-like protein